jgi:hypothetical protein
VQMLQRFQLFLSLFFGTFFIGASGVWLYDNRGWLRHEFDRVIARPSFKLSTGPISGIPTEPLIKLPSNSDWQKNWTPPSITVPQFKFSPPRIPPIPQVPMPRVPPPPMGIRR